MIQPDVALITGAAGRIGAETARLFAESGASVALLDVDHSEHASRWEGSDVSSLLLEADIRELPSLIEAADRVRETFGHVNTIVANAGALTQPVASFEELSPEDWRETLRVNLEGHFNTVKAFLPLLKTAPGQRSIVLISSVLGIRGSGYMSAYATAKSALVGLTSSLAHDLGRHQITVNAVAPALTREPDSGDATRTGQVERLIETIPLGRIGTPTDVADAIAFLSSARARFITGQLLVVDGGLTSTAFWQPYW